MIIMIDSFAIISLRGVSTELNMASYTQKNHETNCTVHLQVSVHVWTINK